MKTKICVQCKKEFTLTDSELEFYKVHGLSEPKRCKACRALNQMRQNGIVHTDRDGNIQPDFSERTVYSDEARARRKRIDAAAVQENRKHRGVWKFVWLILALLSFFACFASPAFLLPLVFCFTAFVLTVCSGKEASTRQYDADEITLSAAEYKRCRACRFQFRNETALKEHFCKHAEEVGAVDVADYLEKANAVLKNPKARRKRNYENNRADTVFFSDSTFEVVFLSEDGYIRTYYVSKKSFETI